MAMSVERDSAGLSAFLADAAWQAAAVELNFRRWPYGTGIVFPEEILKLQQSPRGRA
jgi:hypothetical protein